MKRKLIRVAASPISLDLLLKGQLNYLNGFFDVLAVAPPGAEHARIRRREGVETVELEMERTISLWKDLKSLWRLFLLFRRERPWGVHSVTPKAGLLSMAAAALARVPVRVHTFTGLIFPYRKGAFKFLLKQMDRLTCLFATHVIPEGEGVRQLLMAEKVTGKPLEILAHGNVNGVDPDYFRRSGCREEVRKRLELPEDAVLFVFVGRITEDKGIRELLAAFDREGADRLLLLGDILYHGENVTGKSVNAAKYRSHVGMVFQSFNLFNNKHSLEPLHHLLTTKIFIFFPSHSHTPTLSIVIERRYTSSHHN